MPRIDVRPATTPADLEQAAEIWYAATRARDRVPSAAREARVREKVRQGPVVLLATYGDRPAGMAVAEPLRDGDRLDPACGHVSMVFVHPALWGLRVGTALMRALQSPPDGTDWDRLSVWTRVDNRRSRRLYASVGFVDTGERSLLHSGASILRLAWARA